MITSKSNPQIKRLIQLQKKSKARAEEKVFVVEGIRMFVEVPKEHARAVMKAMKNVKIKGKAINIEPANAR